MKQEKYDSNKDEDCEIFRPYGYLIDEQFN